MSHADYEVNDGDEIIQLPSMCTDCTDYPSPPPPPPPPAPTGEDNATLTFVLYPSNDKSQTIDESLCSHLSAWALIVFNMVCSISGCVLVTHSSC